MKTIEGLSVHKDAISETGVFADKSHAVGESMGLIEGEILPGPSRYSICLEGRHVDPWGPYRYLNHSCAPNSECRGNELVAIQDIALGEEITIDYVVTEKTISHPFSCLCGDPDCRGFIGDRV